jgi:heptosyltransferase I
MPVSPLSWLTGLNLAVEIALNPPFMRILIIKPSSLGDVIHALPAVNLIRRQFPDAHISWVIAESLTSLLKHSPVINALIPFPRHEYRKLPAFLNRLRTGRYDIVVDLQGLLRSGIFSRLTGAPRRIGLSDARECGHLFHNEIVPVPHAHAVERCLQAAQHLGCPAGPVEFPLGLPSKIESPKTKIAINPSARWDTKLWGDDRFAELIRRLPHERVVLTGAASERDRIERIAQGCVNLAGKTDLFQLAELYRECAVVVSNDSGPMHIAAAVGTPVVAIFGPTDPKLTGPYGKNNIVLRAGIPCSPCLKGVCEHTPKMECMSLVSVESVVSAVKRFTQIS